jgi:hypothetical protein
MLCLNPDVALPQCCLPGPALAAPCPNLTPCLPWILLLPCQCCPNGDLKILTLSYLCSALRHAPCPNIAAVNITNFIMEFIISVVSVTCLSSFVHLGPGYMYLSLIVFLLIFSYYVNSGVAEDIRRFNNRSSFSSFVYYGTCTKF